MVLLSAFRRSLLTAVAVFSVAACAQQEPVQQLAPSDLGPGQAPVSTIRQVPRQSVSELHATTQKSSPLLLGSSKVSRLNAASPSKKLSLVFNLPLRNEDQLDALLADLYNPFSPKYHHYLSPREFDLQFGPDQADYEALKTWAKDKGFVITQEMTNHRLLVVEAPVSAVNQALHTTIANYHDADKNRDFFAPDTEPTLDLPVPVMDIQGLDNATPPTRHVHKGTPEELAKRPRLTGSGPSGEYLPSDMRAAYYGNGPLTGAGQTVAIFSFDGYLPADLTLYYQNTGMTPTVPITNVLTGGFSGGCVLNSPCDDGEQILDIMQVMGMAPGLSSILFYENGSSANPELAQMTTDNLAKVISSSWSGGGFASSSDTYFKQMATQGQTYLNATGDSGAYNSSTYLAPGLDPYILEVGGTDLVTGSGGAWSSETAWAGSSGGFRSSAGYGFPTWQNGIVTTANKASATYRNSPDVAAEANYDNPTVAGGLFEGGYGGTSFATPRYAGYLALANQQAVANGQGTLGFINPTIYSLGLGTNSTTTPPATNYHDITSGTNPSTVGTSTTYSAGAGYDLVTGFGSPNGAGLINSLAGTPFQDFGLTATSPALTLVRNSSVTDKIAITKFNGFGPTPTFTFSGLPTGVAAAVYASGDGTYGTLTFYANNTMPFSTSSVVVTGTAGGQSHALTYTLKGTKVANADFTITATSPAVMMGGSAASVITVTETNLPAPVNLSIGTLPSGLTAALDNTSTSSGANLTFTASSSILPGTYSVVLTATYPTVTLNHSVTIPVTVTTPGTNLLVNPGFETGSISPWTLTSSTGNTGYIFCSFATCGVGANSGNYFLELDGYGTTHTDTVSQTVTIPSNVSTVNLSFFLGYLTAETSKTAVHDTFVASYSINGGAAVSLASLNNTNLYNNVGYSYHTYALPAAAIGQSVTITFTGTENSSLYSEFLLDDVSLYVQ